MCHDGKNHLPNDSSRINLEVRAEVDYWCGKLGITPERLRELIAHVGVMADEVRRAAAQTNRSSEQ